MRNMGHRKALIKRVTELAENDVDLERDLILVHIEDKAHGDSTIHPCARAELLRLMKDIRAGRHRDGAVVNETGNEYGELHVLRKDTSNPNVHAFWICECSCGNQCSVRQSDFRRGDRKTCGKCRGK